MKWKHVLVNEENNLKVVFETFANAYTQVPYIRRCEYYLHSNVFISSEPVVHINDAIEESDLLKGVGYKEE